MSKLLTTGVIGSSRRRSTFFDLFPDASALYGTQNLYDKKSAVLRARRSYDNAESNFTAKQLSDGTLLDFAVPTDVQNLYNNAMFFDGVNDSVATTFAQTNASNWAIEFEGTMTSTSFVYLASTRNGAHGWAIDRRISTSNLRFNVLIFNGSIGADYAFNNYVIPLGQFRKWKIQYVSGTLTLWENDVLVDTRTSINTLSIAGDIDLGIGYRRDANNTFYSAGTLKNVKFYEDSVAVAHWIGNGTSNSNWTDQIGSANGTVNGSPVLFTGQGFNAFTPILYDQRVSTAKKTTMDFNGSTGYVSLASRPTPLSVNQNFTL
jgi:hypothetical protein